MITRLLFITAVALSVLIGTALLTGDTSVAANPIEWPWVRIIFLLAFLLLISDRVIDAFQREGFGRMALFAGIWIAVGCVGAFIYMVTH